jgi:broad specificity phosphatase PhoE
MHWRLSTEGRTRSELLAYQIKRLTPDAVYSSPEPKAFETAAIVGAALHLSVKVFEDLREHDRTGVPFFTGPGEFENNVRRFFATPDERVFGLESAADALARFRNAMAEVLSCGDHQPMVVTHGTVMSLYVAAVAGLDAATVWRKLSMPCYVVLGTGPGNANVRIEHLTGVNE